MLAIVLVFGVASSIIGNISNNPANNSPNITSGQAPATQGAQMSTPPTNDPENHLPAPQQKPSDTTPDDDKPLMPDNPNGTASQIKVGVEKDFRITMMVGQSEDACLSNYINQVPGSTTRADAINGAVDKCKYLIQVEKHIREQNNVPPTDISDQTYTDNLRYSAKKKVDETFGPAR